MKRLLSILLLVIPFWGYGQEIVVVAETQDPSFLNIVKSGGILGILNWAGIFLAGTTILPLGVVTIVNCSLSKTGQRPLSMNLLIWLSIWVFLLGWIGLCQGVIRAFTIISMVSYGNALARAIGDAVYSMSIASHIANIGLLFLLPSFIILHTKRKKQNGTERG